MEIKRHKRTVDLEGQIFGKLTVVEFVGYKNQKVQWKCLCECGNIIITKADNLKSGYTKSCGCLKSITQRRKTKDLIGRVFGKLTVVEFAGYGIRKNGRNFAQWLCRCECGNKIITRANALNTGNTKSCGCSIIGENNPNYNYNLTDEERIIKRNTPENPIWRKAVYERDSHTCQCCGNKSENFNAHHIANWADNPKLRYCIDNGITLCEDCHYKFHKQYGRRNTTITQLKEFIKNENN